MAVTLKRRPYGLAPPNTPKIRLMGMMQLESMEIRSASAVLTRQLTAFFGVGLLAALAHYGVLIGLVEAGGMRPVPATLLGYVAGGIVSYVLNRRLTYASDRPHAEAGWRFGLVAAVGFVLTGAFMHVLTDRLGAPYLPAQVVTTGIVLVWSFLAHKMWTFRGGVVP
jgi:putative flippase GtrA